MAKDTIRHFAAVSGGAFVRNAPKSTLKRDVAAILPSPRPDSHFQHPKGRAGHPYRLEPHLYLLTRNQISFLVTAKKCY